jgi:hypothetical protein
LEGFSASFDLTGLSPSNSRQNHYLTHGRRVLAVHG